MPKNLCIKQKSMQMKTSVTVSLTVLEPINKLQLITYLGNNAVFTTIISQSLVSEQTFHSNSLAL